LVKERPEIEFPAMDTLKDKLSDLQNKAKERTVKTQNIEYDLETLVKKIKKGVIKLDPEYQRRHRWDRETSSRLIESLILNIPIPLIYISQDVDVDKEDEEETARYSVIDGQQRLTAILDFLENKYALEELNVLSDLAGSFYKDLPPFLVRRLEERTIRCLRIDSTVDSQVKYDIFERLNSGSVKLEPQELRNAVSRGPFNDLIKELAQSEDFRVLLQIDPHNPMDSKKVQTMEDVELVLRFFCLIDDNYKNLKGGFKQFLNSEMDKKKELDKKSLKQLETAFLKTMKVIRQYFGETAFAKYRVEKGAYITMSRFNAAVYDALSVGVKACVDLNNPTITDKQIANYKKLFADPDFFRSVEGSVNDRNKIVVRIDAVKEVLS
jgi:hypothetical protein